MLKIKKPTTKKLSKQKKKSAMRFDDYATGDKLNGVYVILDVWETSVLTFEARAFPVKKST